MPTGPPDQLLPDTVLTVITGSVLVVLGAILGASGVWLAVLGGSWGYIGLGAGVMMTGILLARRRRVGLAVYAAMLVATLIWALWEVGFDRWALIPRGALLAVIGLWLLTPWICRPLHGVDDGADRGVRSSWKGPRGWLGGAIVLVILTNVAAIVHDPFDVADRLPSAAMQPGMDAILSAFGNDWLACGGTGHVQRHSPVADITPETMDRLLLARTFDTGDPKEPSGSRETTFEVTPLKIGDTLYLCSVYESVITLDAATGKERWQFDPHIEVGHTSQHLSCRRLAYHDTGRPMWNWDLAHPDVKTSLPAGPFYTPNTPGRWAGGSVGEKLGLVYFPFESQSPDQPGFDRSPEIRRYSSSIVALDTATGQARWRFQDVYVVDLHTGKPIFPVRKLPEPRSTAPGESISAALLSPAPSFIPLPLTSCDMSGATPFDPLACGIEFRSMDYDGPYTPAATRRPIDYPGNAGVFDWRGIAVDPVRKIIIATSVHLAFTYQRIARHDPTTECVSAAQTEHRNENDGSRYAIMIEPCTVRDHAPRFLPIAFPMGVASPDYPPMVVVAAGDMARRGTWLSWSHAR